MGLGPPVCQHCQVIAELLPQPILIKRTNSTKTFLTHTSWRCPFCGETDLTEYSGFDQDRYDRLRANENFLRFITNRQKE